MTIRALSLPGCGCRGAFQFAVLERLQRRGERFDVVAGASSGSIAAAAYVAGKSLDGPRLYRKLASTPVLSPRWLWSEKSPFGMSRIVREALEAYIPEADIARGEAELLLSTTRLVPFARNLLARSPLDARGALVVHSSRSRRNLHDLILASCTFPPFYARLPRIDGQIHIDGGATDNTLVSALVAKGATELTIVTPHATGRVYEGLFREEGGPRVPPHVKVRVIHPTRPLRLKSFDFDPGRLEEALTMPHEEQVRGASE